MHNLKSFITESHTIKYSNVDNNNMLKPMEAARWFQDIFLKQDEVLGIERNGDFTWILLNYDMNIYEYGKIGDKIKIETYPYSFNKFYGNRMFFLKDMDDNILIEAKTRWLLVEKNTFKIKKVTKEIAEVYDLHEIDRGKGFDVDKIEDSLFDNIESKKLNIRQSDLDINNHVNNTLYFSYFYDFIDNEILTKYQPYKIQVTYKKQIKIDDKPKVYTKNVIDNGQLYTNIKICSDNNDKYTLIKILWKRKK